MRKTWNCKTEVNATKYASRNFNCMRKVPVWLFEKRKCETINKTNDRQQAQKFWKQGIRNLV